MNKIFLIDANNIIYRSFFAIKPFTTSTGQPTNAIFGFVSTLLKIFKQYNPQYMAIAFDTPVPTFRHQILEQYKISRKPMPDELSSQIPVIKEIINAFGITSIEKEKFEADDLLACLALKFSEQNYDVVIVSGDKDILQLLSDKISVINPATWEMIDSKKFFEKYCFSPEKIVDFLALCGDASDCIPGVPGIGEKTALQLVQQFGTIESIYENIDKIKGKRKQILLDGKQSAFLSKRLVELSKQVSCEIGIDELKVRKIDIEKIRQIFQKLEFRKFESQISEIFGKHNLHEISKDLFAIGDEIFNFNEIMKDPHLFKEKLVDEKKIKISWNLKEKIKRLASKNIDMCPPYFDFDVASFLLNSVIYDSDILNLYQKYRENLKSQEMSFLSENIEMPLIEVLAFMEINGILVDKHYLEKLKNEYENEMNQLQEKIYCFAGEVFNINSPSQVARILFERLGLPPKKKTKTGYSTDTNVLEQLRNQHQIVDLILQHRELAKLCSTYIDGFSSYINPVDNRIHPEFQQTIASSGRIVCHNPNLQAIPVKTEKGGRIRKIFVAPENSMLYSFDYNQIELRILAHFSKDKNLVEAFKNHRDIHLETARQLFSFDSQSLFGNQEIDIYRRIAKTINFGIIYGMNSYGLAQRLTCTVDQAQAFIESYFAKFQGVRSYIQQAISEAEKLGYAKTLFGRKRYLPEIHSENRNQVAFASRVAINMPIQGTAAELIKLAMIQIHNFIKKNKMKTKMILQIHDELVFEIPDCEVDIVKEIKRIMENVYHLIVPLKVNVQKGQNYLDMLEI